MAEVNVVNKRLITQENVFILPFDINLRLLKRFIKALNNVKCVMMSV